MMSSQFYSEWRTNVLVQEISLRKNATEQEVREPQLVIAQSGSPVFLRRLPVERV